MDFTRYDMGLFNWIQRSRHESVAAMLADGSDPNGRDPDGNRPLHVATWRRDVKMIELLIAAGATVDARDASGCTALARAVTESADVDTISTLLSHGANPNIRPSKFGYMPDTPLHDAALKNATAVAALLLRAGADPNQLDRQKATPLEYARSAAMVRTLLAGGARVDLGRGRPIVGAMIAATTVRSADELHAILRMLVDAGAALEDPPEFCSLVVAADSRTVATIEWLLAAGADPNVVDRSGYTVLMRLVREDTAILRVLLAAGATRGRDEALMQTAAAGYLEAAKLLVAAGANPDFVNDFGKRARDVARTPAMIAYLATISSTAPLRAMRTIDAPTLHEAILQAGHFTDEEVLAAVDAHLANGVAIDATDEHGFTALEHAIDSGIVAVVERLLAAGADVEAGMMDEIRPVMRAASAAHESNGIAILEKMLAAGANVTRNIMAGTILHQLAHHGPAAAIERIIGAGANPNARDAGGMRAYEYAVDPEVRAALQPKKGAR